MDIVSNRKRLLHVVSRTFQWIVTKPASNLLLIFVLQFTTTSLVRAEALPTYGIAVEGPSGWKSFPRDRGKRASQWVALGVDGKPDKLIQIDCGQALDSTIQESATSLVKQLGGTVEKSKVDIDGVEAIKIVIPHRGSGMSPVEAIVTRHDGLTYFIFGAATAAASNSSHDAIDEVLKSWKWVERLPPSRCLHTTSVIEPDRLGLRFAAPVGAAIIPGVQEHPSLHLALRDPSKSYDEVLILTQKPTVPEGGNFETTLSSFRDGWNAAGKTKEKLEWKTSDANANIFVSNTLSIAETPEDEKQRGSGPQGHIVWAIRQLDEKHLLLVSMTIISDDAKEIEVYSRYLDSFVRKVEKLPSRE